MLRLTKAEYNRKYRQEHPEYFRRKRAEWYAAHPNYFKQWRKRNHKKVLEGERCHRKHPRRIEQKRHYAEVRRARLYGSGCITLTQQEWEQIVAAFDRRCAYCGSRPRKLTQDHVLPLSRCGTHTKKNVVPACRRCNAKKGTRTLQELGWEKPHVKKPTQ